MEGQSKMCMDGLGCEMREVEEETVVADLWTLICWCASCTQVQGIYGSNPKGHQPRQTKIAQLRHTSLLHVYHVLHPAGRRMRNHAKKTITRNQVLINRDIKINELQNGGKSSKSASACVMQPYLCQPKGINVTASLKFIQ